VADRREAGASTEVLARPTAVPLPIEVRVSGGRAIPEKRRLGSGKLVIGAAKECDIVVEDGAVSRRHVELELVPEGVLVRDLASRNGTFHLGRRIEGMVVPPGSRIAIGQLEVAFEPDLDALGERPSDDASYRGLMGVSSAMRRLFGTLARLEGSLVTVLVTGESGVGKELVARAIHEGSSRRGEPLVVKNCGALQKELAASELFGHKRGAFTGAIEGRVGAFEAAHGGTLFLDEVGELPLDIQPLLLRALEAGEITPVGTNEVKMVKVRIVAATHQSLEDQVEAGTFRQDLFYRLAVVRVHVPPLRERPEDVPALAQHFAERAGGGTLPPEAVRELSKQTWKGNARELRNAIEAYLAIGEFPPVGREVDLVRAALHRAMDLDRPFLEQREALADRFTELYLRALLHEVDGNQSEAARRSGLERSYLRKLLAKHGIGAGGP